MIQSNYLLLESLINISNRILSYYIRLWWILKIGTMVLSGYFISYKHCVLVKIYLVSFTLISGFDASRGVCTYLRVPNLTKRL